MKFIIINLRKLTRKTIIFLLTPISYIVQYIATEIIFPNSRDRLDNILFNRAIYDSAIYIEQNLSEALIFSKREDLWKFILGEICVDGIYAEFGVFSGNSINYFSKNIKNKTFFGFDSFQGLKEDWFGTSFNKSYFDLKGNLPKVNKNVILIKGWFNNTLPLFLSEYNDNFSFIHMDADTFESTTLILNLIKNRIIKNTIIVFDEYHGFPNWRNSEYLAWKNFVTNNNIQYKYLAFSEKQSAIIVL